MVAVMLVTMSVAMPATTRCFPGKKINDDGESRVFSMTKKNDSTERFRKDFSRFDG